MCRSVFIDESGSVNKDRGLLLLAGYVSTNARWMRFADEWQGILDAHGLDEIHTKELWDGTGAFDETRIPWDGRKKIIAKCADIVHRRTELAVRVSLRVEDYNAVVRGRLIAQDVLDHPYFLLFRVLLGAVWKLAPLQSEQDSVAFFFDEQDQFSRAAIDDFRFYRKLMELWGQVRCDGPRYENSKTFLPLQAADMLAWQQHRLLTKPAFEWPAKPDPPDFLHWCHLDRAWLERFVQGTTRDVTNILKRASSDLGKTATELVKAMVSEDNKRVRR